MGDTSRPGSARPGTAGVHITEHPVGKVNPSPISQDETETLIEEYLSPRKLRALTGFENLEEVKYLEMRVDSSETSLGNFGYLLPNMTQLKLNNSIIPYVRDLGTSFPVLRVLWMARCNLVDLDGITAMTNLKELYLAYNDVTDLSPFSMMDKLEILDLEGNNITDENQIEFLSLCGTLRNLTLEGNPITSDGTVEGYRSSIRCSLENLEILDDLPLTTDDATVNTTFDTDWNFLSELEADGTIMSLNNVEEREQIVASPICPTTGYRPGTSLRPSSALKRLGSAGSNRMIGTASASDKSNTRPTSSDSGHASEPVTDTSDLTSGDLVCGNPARALRARRRQVRLHDTRTANTIFEKFHHVPEHSYPEPTVEEEDDQLLDELKAWRLQHTEVQKKLEASRAPNVLTIIHDDETSMSGGSSDEESDEEGRGDSRNTADEDQGFVSRQDNQSDDDLSAKQSPHEVSPSHNHSPVIKSMSLTVSGAGERSPINTSSPPQINGATLRSRRYKMAAAYAEDERSISSGPVPFQRQSIPRELPKKPVLPPTNKETVIIRADINSPEKPRIDRVSLTARAAIHTNTSTLASSRPIQALPSRPFRPNQ